MYRDCSADELAAVLGSERAPFVLDVRERDEFAAWSIPGAVNIPLGELVERVGELTTDREIVAVCASGNRSTIAAEALGRAGWPIANLVGGMASWGTVHDWVTFDAGPVEIVQVRRRGTGCLSYVVGTGRDAFVIDASVDTDMYREIAAEHGWTITGVFDTHLHADHVSGSRALAQATGAPVYLNPADAFDFEFEPIADGQAFALGGVRALTAVHVPGHTRGSTAYLVGDHAVLTGDTLFVDGVGRPDLAEQAEEFAHNLYRSLHTRILSLPDDLVVLPGHFGEQVPVRAGTPVGASLAELRSTLSPLSYGEEEFVSWATGRSTPRPPNYVRIIKTNARGDRHVDGALRQLELGPNRCSAA